MDLNDEMEMAEIPESTIIDGEITEVEKGKRAEIMDKSNFEDNEWPTENWDDDDEVVEVTATYNHRGTESTVSKVFPYYEKPHPRSGLGRFRRQYGKFPATGMDVQLAFDENGIGQIVLAGE